MQGHPIGCISQAQGAGTGTPVSRYGWLQVKGGLLCSEAGEPVQLRGISSHHLRDFPLGSNSVACVVGEWNISVLRLAMYTDPKVSGYIADPTIKKRLKFGVDQSIRNGLYVIVDWHILGDGNPNQYRKQARAFFSEIARDYRDQPNLIYEICNEPNGKEVTWKEIKSYANYIIPAIRAIDKRHIIVVGTDTWCQGVTAAADSPLDGTNLMYAFHFYAGSHGDYLRRKADTAISRHLPLFVTEWGLTDSSGDGPLHPDEAKKWLDWVNGHRISWVNWSFSNKAESSALLKPTASLEGPWSDNELSPAGLWLKDHTRNR